MEGQKLIDVAAEPNAAEMIMTMTLKIEEKKQNTPIQDEII